MNIKNVVLRQMYFVTMLSQNCSSKSTITFPFCPRKMENCMKGEIETLFKLHKLESALPRSSYANRSDTESPRLPQT